MNKQELFKQADYNFQRGNCELAKKYLADFIAQYPNEEAAWMLKARIEEEPERQIECYQRALKINPGNSEAKIWIARIKSTDKTLPKYKRVVEVYPLQKSSPFKNFLRGVSIFAVLVILFGTTSYVVARNNPKFTVAKLLIIATPTLSVQIPITGNIAAKTRAEMTAKYPQYAPVLDAVIGFAVNNADSGQDGAPKRPGEEITSSDAAGKEAKVSLENALPKPGSLSSTTLSEAQLTSWLAMEMKNSPDLPLSNVQVYLRDGKIQIWGEVTGSENSTSALIVGNVSIDSNKNPVIGVESVQIGKQKIPGVLVSQMESWLNQLLTEKINQQVPGLQIMNIKVTNGLITISGMR
jgi:tetratricopeptide (TPR) repeat protein